MKEHASDVEAPTSNNDDKGCKRKSVLTLQHELIANIADGELARIWAGQPNSADAKLRVAIVRDRELGNKLVLRTREPRRAKIKQKKPDW